MNNLPMAYLQAWKPNRHLSNQGITLLMNIDDIAHYLT